MAKDQPAAQRPHPATILDQSPLGGRGLILDLERTSGFVPGQVLGLALGEDHPPRWYSIASGTDWPRFQILYTPVEGGLLTPPLSSLGTGSTVWVWPPRGEFLDTHGPDTKVWWICNGTGVAPFASMFRSGIRANRVLVHGSTRSTEAWFAQEFTAPGVQGQGFTYLPCLSQESAPASDPAQGVPGLPCAWKGRLTAWLEAQTPEIFAPTDRFMLCGSPGMIVEVRELLTRKGIAHERITSEIYF